MYQDRNKPQNALAKFRRRRGYSQHRVAHLLGHKSHAALSLYENGRVLPTLVTALKLEIILRTPVAFLYPELHDNLKKKIREEEDLLAGYGQQTLFEDHSTGLL